MFAREGVDMVEAIPRRVAAAGAEESVAGFTFAGGIMTQSAMSLYRRMGGYDVIAAVIDDMLPALQADPAFARFDAGRSLDSHARTRQLLVDQMCELSARPCHYIGRDMRTSHTGLGTSGAEWDVSMKYADEALVKSAVGDAERAEFLGLFDRYRTDIVEGSTRKGPY